MPFKFLNPVQVPVLVVDCSCSAKQIQRLQPELFEDDKIFVMLRAAHRVGFAENRGRLAQKESAGPKLSRSQGYQEDRKVCCKRLTASGHFIAIR